MQKNEVTARQIAKAAGVSPSAVSLVLNNKADDFRISPKTQEKIIQTANQMGYKHVARKKRKVSAGKAIIYVFCPVTFSRGPIGEFYSAVQKYMKEQELRYEVVLFPFETGKLIEKQEWIHGRYAAGAIMVALTESDIEFIENNRFDIPMVLFNRSAEGYCSVLMDDYAVGSKAMSHFIARGHKTFGIISPDYPSKSLSLRTVGYYEKYKGMGSGDPEVHIVSVSCENDGETGGFEAMSKLLRAPKVPTAIFVTSDNMVSGVVRCINEYGYKIPDDFEIISYGNTSINLSVEPNVSSFHPPIDEMSYNCVRVLTRFINDKTLMTNLKLIFDAECIFRESSPAL